MEVWRGMDQATIDREYNARASVADFDAELRQYQERSTAARAALPYFADLVFDPASGCALDWFKGEPGGPVLLWIHGGYWRALSKADQSCVAPGLVSAGVHVAVMDYSLAPMASLDLIVHQVRSALAFVGRKAARFGADPGRMFVGGSSAGGHLAAMVMEAPIRGGVCISGLYDLEPIRLSHINGWMNLDGEAVQRLSPINHIPRGPAPKLLVSYGGLETGEFKRQSVAFAAAWASAGHGATVVPQAARNHFDIVAGLADANDPLCRSVCDFMLCTPVPTPRTGDVP